MANPGRPDVRGNQMMIDKVYDFADQAPTSSRPPSKEEQRDKRQAAQEKRMRKAAKRAQT